MGVKTALVQIQHSPPERNGRNMKERESAEYTCPIFKLKLDCNECKFYNGRIVDECEIAEQMKAAFAFRFDIKSILKEALK